MENNLRRIIEETDLSNRKIFLFGHCAATLELVDLLEEKGLSVTAILDNSSEKQGLVYKGAEVVLPDKIIELAGQDPVNDSIVLITSRFYASMQKQLRELGYTGPIRKLIDYNTYAEYSLSEDTINRMTAREKHGEDLTKELILKHGHVFKVFCPFNALGDIYLMMSYWNSFARTRGIDNPLFCVPGRVLADIIHMFGDYPVEVYEQKELDAMIQAAIYTQDDNSYIAHQDRPYIINLHRALYVKKISLEQIYCCGVFGLPADTEPAKPQNWKVWPGLDSIEEGNAVILSPYAKSVTAIDNKIWEDIIMDYKNRGYQVFTNICGEEEPLQGTISLRAEIYEMKSVLERAGTFIGIRSGLCDVIKTANCRKIALYPDYNYSDTKWKAIDLYSIREFENIVVKEGDLWEEIWKNWNLM